MEIYNPNKSREKTYEQPGSNNVSIGDIHLVGCLKQITPFSIKKVHDTNFSSIRERGNECQGLSLSLIHI